MGKAGRSRLPPLWGFFRKVLPPFPNFLSLLPVTQKLAAQQARVEIGRLGNKMRLADTDAEPGKPLVGDAAGIAGLVLVHKKPVERLPRRAAVGSETQQIRHLILHREPEKLRVRAEIGNEHLRAGGLADGTAYAEGKQVRHHGRKETAHRIADKIRSPDDVGKTRLDGHGNGRGLIQRG